MIFGLEPKAVALRAGFQKKLGCHGVPMGQYWESPFSGNYHVGLVQNEGFKGQGLGLC